MTLADTLFIADTKYQRVPVAQPRYVGWRCLHAREGGFLNPVGMPNVRRAVNQPPVEFTDELQALTYELMVTKNPTISRNEFDNVFDSETAFTNRHGVESNDPKLMDGIICAGMFLPAAVEGDYLVAYPGIHAIDPRVPLPTVQQILDRGWYFVANTGTGFAGAFNLPQGNQGPVYIPYVLQAPARYPMRGVEEGRAYVNFERWESDVRPDPLRYGG